jgi:hypothetical protein
LSFLIELSTASPLAFHVFVVEGGFGMRKWCALLMVVLCALWVMPAMGQYDDDNESYNASDVGVDLNGQGGFYLPPAGGQTCKAFTYTNNALAFPQNPNGGEKFVGGIGPGGSVFLRSQKDVSIGDGTGVWKIEYDVAVKFIGVLPTAQNVGSFSTQVLPGAKTFIALITWTNPATAENWDADVVSYNSAGTQSPANLKIPDVRFQGLLANRWYRRSFTVDYDSNKLIDTTVTDLTSGDTATYVFDDNYIYNYLGGGQNGGPAPNGFRYFSGTAAPAGNTNGFDNLSIQPVGGGGTCSYEVANNVKAKGGCAACPSKGDTYDFGVDCDDENPCKAKATAKNVACPDGNPGSCKKIKGKKNTGVCG